MEEDEDFDDYIWLENIGKGSGQNTVCKVKHLTENKTYALKKILVDIKNKDQTEKNKNEINIFKGLDHPYIIKYYESFFKPPYLCIIMEYAAGGDLQHVIKHYSKQQKQIPEKQIWTWFIELCQAIRYIHLKHIIHRDLKTQNVFLDQNGHVKLGDFGISKTLDNTMDYAKTSLGTPYFLSPEICQGEVYNLKTDIWMLGCVLFELSSLKIPFKGDNLVQLMMNIIKESVPPIPTHYSDELNSIVQLLMKKDPNERPTIAEILEMDIVQTKFKEYRIDEILLSPLLTCKQKEHKESDFSLQLTKNYQSNSQIYSQDQQIKELSSEISKVNLSAKNTNNPNVSILSMNKIGHKVSIVDNGTEKMRKKTRVPDKINKKYDSMGQQAFGKVMEDMNLNPLLESNTNIPQNQILNLIPSNKSAFKQIGIVNTFAKYNQITPSYKNHETQLNMDFNKKSITEGTKLEDIYKRQDFTNDITIKLNFVKKKCGEDNLINIIRYLDKNKGVIAEKEMVTKINSIIGEQNYAAIQNTLLKALKSADYKFKI